MQILSLNHVGLFVSDLDRSIAFYGDVLGLTRKPRPDFGDRGAWFIAGPGQELHVIERPSLPHAAPEPPTHFALVVEDETETLAYLETQKVPIVSHSHRPDGAAQILIRDPDGHSIELTCNLP